MAQKFLTGVQLTDGSAGSPALSFSSDTNTGIYRSEDDTVNISVGGTSRFYVNSSGIVSSANIYSGGNGQFRNYSGVWKATTGVSGNGFEFTSADQTGAMTLTSNGNLKVHNNIRSQGHSTTGLSGKGMELRFFTDTDIGSILSYDRDNNAYLPIGVFGSTVSLQTSGTERLHITNAGNVGIGVASASIDQKLRVNGNIKIGDSQKFLAGAGDDLEIYHDGSNSRIENNTGHLYIRNDANNSDIIFQTDDGNDNVETYFFLDGSAGGTNPITIFPDSSYLKFGDSQDLSIAHTGSYSEISHNGTGNLTIQNTTDDGDIIFKSDDGSGGLATYFFLDGSNVNVSISKQFNWLDSVVASFGNSADLQIFHNSTDSFIDNHTGNLTIRNRQDDGDILFVSDDGSGGLATYFFLDGSSVTTQFYKTIKLYDDAQIYIGDDNDLRFYHNGTSNIDNYTGNLDIIQRHNDGDIRFYNDDGSGGTTEYFRIDGGATKTIISKAFQFFDNVKAEFGDSSDLKIFHDGSGSKVENYIGNLTIQQRADDSDIVFQCDDGSGDLTDYFRLDGSATNMKVSKDMRFLTSVDAEFGTGGDFKIYHDGSNQYLDMINSGTGNIVIQNQNDDADIIFKSDNGSGGLAEYFSLDGSITRIKFSKNLHILDNVRAEFGGDNDLQIYHDGTDSYIHDNGTGDLRVRTNRFVLNNAADTENLIRAEQNSSVELFYDNSKKLETTNTGVTITGDLEVTGTTTTVNQTNLDVSDNIIGLNRGASTNTNDSGLIIERGSTGDNAAFLWDESEDKFVFGLTTATPSATGNVSLSDYRGIKTGPITASGSITASSDVTTSGSYFADTHFRSTDGNATLSATGGGGIYLRPNGFSSTTGQVLIDASNGDATFSGGLSVNTSGSIYGTDNQTASIYMTGSGNGLSGKFGTYARNLIRSNGTNTIQIGDNTSLISLIQLKAGSSSVDGVIQLMTHNTERMRVTHDGRVGVNTSSPGAKLHVVESTTNTQAFRVDDGTSFVSVVPSLGSGGYTGVSSAGDIGLIFSIDGDNTTDTTNGLLIAPHTQTSGGLKILENGNVGIGVATPNTKLQVAGIIQSTESGNSAFYGGDYVRVFNNQNFRFRNSGGTVIANIAMSGNSYFNGGNVGVGTTAPDRLLHLYKSSGTTAIKIEAGDTSQASVDLKNTESWFRIITNGGALRFWDQSNNVERIRINSSGNVGVGTTAPQTNTKLEVSGALKAGNKTSWSDRDGDPLTTTGRVVAGLTGNANGNGASAMYIFTCYGGNGYQRIVYSCRNQGGTWVVNKDIDEGVDAFDVVASTPSSGSAVTFTFKGRTSSQSYTASVFIEHMGHNLDTQYVG